jgi:cysteine desulfurase/selenocysteine lyase
MIQSNIRKDFPVLERKIKKKSIIYFDNACSSLKPWQVIRAMDYYYRNLNACGGFRSSHDLSKETDELCEKARESARRFINAKSLKEIVWTRNTTEAINLVAKSLVFEKHQNVVCTLLDHHSGILPFYKLHEEGKIKELRIAEIEKDGMFDIGMFEKIIDDSTMLVSILMASNVTGTIAPVKEICELAHEHGALVIADGAQFVPHYKTDVQDLDVDFLAFSMHKMCGPSGMGILYGKSELLEQLDTFLVGGETIRDVRYSDGTIEPSFLPPPKRFEAGIQNYAGIIGSGAAFDYLQKIRMDNIEKQEKELTERFMELFSKLDGVELIGPFDPSKRGSLFSFVLKNKNVSPKDVADYMNTDVENYKIMLRAGAHCANPFHHHIGLSPVEGFGTVRASLYFYNTIQEIEIFIRELEGFLRKIGV